MRCEVCCSSHPLFSDLCEKWVSGIKVWFWNFVWGLGFVFGISFRDEVRIGLTHECRAYNHLKKMRDL